MLGVSGLPSLKNSDLNPECLDYHKSGVSERMAGLSGPLPVRPVPPTGQTGPTQTKNLGFLDAAKITHKFLNPYRH